MDSRANILQAIARNQPVATPLPDISTLAVVDYDSVEKFTTTLEGIGGQVIEIETIQEITSYVNKYFTENQRIISTLSELSSVAETDWQQDDPHSLENVELCILEAQFGVAENGALWLTEAQMGQRVAPFITQNLAVVVKKTDLLPTMHHAYDRIAQAEYPFGLFLAGPSKTADIEQSLVLGAHGSRSMTVFLMS
ncbi:LutC/YkgG family protein [Salmonirosea aquatica]|uniref:Lactate utilization protein B/C n=1 Tax=Salmonirosea aquatica TaxID=2654236 RepID=A0A7C9FE41_9BACT|nr:lactate utilization protein B/C [Cytophagaceae bacterium SJW1-29]